MTTGAGASINQVYPMRASQVERERLNLQHVMLKRILGDKLLPTDAMLKGGDAILDSCTGTGIWTEDAAKEVPADVSIFGTDIEPRMFPTSPPRNVFLLVHSALALPEDWICKFIVVHQRLAIAAFNRKEWKKNLAELYRVLKPGGWIRLEEIVMDVNGLGGTSDIPTRMPNVHKILTEMSHFFGQRDLILDCTNALPELLTDAGFKHITVQTEPWVMGPGDSPKDGRDCLIRLFRELKVPLLTESGATLGIQSDEEWEELLQTIEKELRENYVYIPFHAFTGRKLA